MNDTVDWKVHRSNLHADGSGHLLVMYGETLLSDVRIIVSKTQFGWGYTLWVDSSDIAGLRECIGGGALESWEIGDAQTAALADPAYIERVNV